MHHFLSLFFPLLTLIGLHMSGFEGSVINTLTVKNGLHFGSWGKSEFCPRGLLAAGFCLKVERPIYGDDTALNGIRLHCVSSSRYSNDTSTVESDTARWGEWTDIKWCPTGFLTSFQLRVENLQGSGDDTAANNIRFKCSHESILEGKGTDWGDWGEWSDVCTSGGVCGIQTRVEEWQQDGDDTALNDVQFICCD